MMEPSLIAALIVAAVALMVGLVALILLLRTAKQMSDLGGRSAAASEALTRLTENSIRLQAALDEQRKAGSEEMKLLHQALEGMLSSSDKRLTAGLEETRKAIVDVTGRLSALDQAGKDLKEAVQRLAELRRLLAAPGARGSFGERLMEQWIREVLPAKYVLTQHEIPGAGRVDLAIRVGERVIPVDSKFPTDVMTKVSSADNEEALKAAKKELARNLRDRVAEVAKYVRPDQGTYPFALMFVPSEGAFLEVVSDSDVLRAALDKKVIPVGPGTFLAYLEVIHEGLRGLEVEEKTQLILEELETLKHLAGSAEESLSLHEKHIRNASNSLAETRKALTRFSDALERLHSIDPGADDEG